MKPVPDDTHDLSSPHHRGRGRLGALALATSVALAAGALAVTPAYAEEPAAPAPAATETATPEATTAPEETPAATEAPAATDAPAPVVETPAPAEAAAPVEAPAARALVAPAAAAPAPTNTIAEVQGTADVSPMVGKTVTVEGVVTADYRVGGYKGIVIQTKGTGGAVKTPGSSDGIFIFLNALKPTLAMGDLVSVTGSVSEYFGQTQITPKALGDVIVVQPGLGGIAPVPLPDTVVGDAREAYENMLVAPTGTYRLASSHQLYTYGTLWLNAGADLNVKSTETERPGAAAAAIADANRANRILLDDGWSFQATNKDYVGPQPYFTKDQVVRNGDKVVFPAEGEILQWGFSDWRLQPVVPINGASDASHKATFQSVNTRPAAAPSVAGDVRVASFNVYNYFTTLSSQDPNARGAKTAEQFAIQKSKIVAAIDGLNADVVALMEIENGPKFGLPLDGPLADLVQGLNDKAGSAVWDYVRTPQALNDTSITDVITAAIIYKKGAVTPKGAAQTVAIDETVWGNAREPIAQTFTAGSKTITVVANHLKSKTPPKGATGEPADGQGYFNADRVAQAKSVLAFTDQLKTSSGSDDILLIGDFNAYAKEDPIDVFTQAGWTDVAPTHAQGQHTYSYDGELGSLDHVIASPSLASSIAGAGVWGINSPEWGDRGYAFGATEAGTPFRSSDHDPIIVGITAPAKPVDINVVTINDFHGRIEADNAAAGAAVLSGAVKQIRAANPNTIFAAAGDLIGASTFTSFIQQDNPTIDALNEAGLDVSAAGNHEFDQGWADLRDRVQSRADWEYISSNVFLTATGQPALTPAWVKEVAGIKVGFIGAVTEDLPTLVSPDGMKGLEVRSIPDSVNKVAHDLRDGDPSNGEADVIILLVHEGATTTNVSSITPESRLGQIVNGVDKSVNAIVSAHTHLAYNHVIDGRPVVSAGQYGENLGLMDIKVDPTTKKLLSITNEIKPLVKKESVGGKDVYTPLYPADPAVKTIVDAAKKKADELGAVKLGDITADFNRAQTTGKAENRGGESTLGNFVADVQKWSTGADFAFMNPGGLRTDLKFASSRADDPDGNVSYREAAAVQPFANTLMTVKLTGAQVKEVLEQQWQPAGSARPFLKLGASKELLYTYDPSAPKGSHITGITVNGAPIEPGATYTVGANAFLAAGGDAFTAFQGGTDKKDTGKVDLQSMVDWFAANKKATPDLAQRATGLLLSQPAGADGYKPGETVVATLSSLGFSTNEKAPGDVSVSIGGTVLGTAPVDPAVVDIDVKDPARPVSDETGRATVSFTVPQGLDGLQTLRFAVAGTDTAISFPITVDGVPATAPGISVSATSVAAGGAVTVNGSGFAAGVAIRLELHSTPVALGDVVTDGNGAFSAAVSIPKDTAAGAHTIVAVLPDGSQVTTPITVTAAAGGTGGGSTGGSGTGALAVTGGEVAPYAALAALLLLVGLGLVAARRRVRAE